MTKWDSIKNKLQYFVLLYEFVIRTPRNTSIKIYIKLAFLNLFNSIFKMAVVVVSAEISV